MGLASVDKGFEGRLRAASSPAIVHELAVRFDRASPDATRDAASAELFIVVVDDGPSARVFLIDLPGDRLILRMQRRADAPRTTAVEKLFDAQLSACELALDVRAAN